MKIAVVYYSMSGNTAFAAREISMAAGADLIEIKPKKAYPDRGVKKFFWGGKSAVMGSEPELAPYAFIADDYDLVVIGSPVWAGRIAPPVRTFIKENAGKLRGKRLAAFLCCAGGNTEKAFSKLEELLSPTRLESKLTLTDPKEKPSKDKLDMIRVFTEGFSETE